MIETMFFQLKRKISIFKFVYYEITQCVIWFKNKKSLISRWSYENRLITKISLLLIQQIQSIKTKRHIS